MPITDPVETEASAPTLGDTPPAELEGSNAAADEPLARPDEPDDSALEEEAPGLGSAEEGRPGQTPSPAKPADNEKKDERRLYVVAACVAGALLLVTLLLFWQSRRDVAALRDQVATLSLQARRSELLQQQAALLRVRADLQGLRQTLPADLALEVDKADGVLAGVADRLRAPR